MLFQVRFFASIMLFKLIYSNFFSKDTGILESLFSCTMNCYEILTDVSFSTSVDSGKHSVSVLRGTSYFFSVSILGDVLHINPSIILIVRRFDQMHRACLVVCSQRGFRKLKFQS